MKQLIYIIFGFIIGVVLCNTTNIPCISQKQADSVAVIDTFIIFNDVYVSDTIYKESIVNIPKYVPKEVIVNDTVYREVIYQTYKDSTESYDISINCNDLNYYQLNIHRVDTLRFRDTINMQIPIIEKKPKPKRWGIGVQTGLGYSPNNNNVSPYIGVGISYNILNF